MEGRERSELEMCFIRLVRRRRLPLPALNVAVGPVVRPKLVVETDGWNAHRGRQAFEDNRARDAVRRVHGYEVPGSAGRQVVGVVAVLRSSLG